MRRVLLYVRRCTYIKEKQSFVQRKEVGRLTRNFYFQLRSVRLKKKKLRS